MCTSEKSAIDISAGKLFPVPALLKKLKNFSEKLQWDCFTPGRIDNGTVGEVFAELLVSKDPYFCFCFLMRIGKSQAIWSNGDWYP